MLLHTPMNRIVISHGNHDIYSTQKYQFSCYTCTFQLTKYRSTLCIMVLHLTVRFDTPHKVSALQINTSSYIEIVIMDTVKTRLNL